MGEWDHRQSKYLLFAVAAAGLSGWVGYRNEVAAVTAAGKPPLTFRSAARHLLTPKTERDAVKRLETLRQRAGRGDLTPSEKLECWQIIRSFSEEQVKHYLAELPPGSWRSANETLAFMLFQRWAQLDPDAAEREMKEEPYSKNPDLPFAVMNARISRDPEAAMRWLEANGSGEMKRIGGRMIGALLVRQDPATALEKAEVLGDYALGAALRATAREMAVTAESRKAFYALQEKYGKTKEWDQAIISLGYAAGARDAEELLGSLEDTGLPEEKSIKLRDRAIGMLMQTDPEKAMNWTMAPTSGVSREKQLSVYRGWAANHSKEAIEWAMQNGRHDLIADSVRQQGKDLARGGWEQWKGEGPQNGWSAGVVDRYRIWRNHDLAAAEAWANTMPTDIRNHLNGKKADVTK